MPYRTHTRVETRAKVLVVDDSARDREIVASMLRTHFDVSEANDVASGLAAFARERPDCVLLDHYLPGRSGLDGLADFVAAHAVVILISGSDSEGIASEAFKRGAHDFLRKDAITQALLVRTITRERERRTLESMLSATRARFDDVAARIAEVLWVRSLDGEFLYLSPAFERIWGRPRAGMTLALWESYVHPEDAAVGQVAWDSIKSGKEYEIEYRIVRPDGQVRRIRNSGYPIIEEGVLARVGGITRDLTEESRMHQELRLAQKLEAIGQLAAGVAHEINTPVQYVGDNLTFLSDSFRGLVPLLEACQRVAVDGVDEHEAVLAIRHSVAEADVAYLVTELPSALQQTAAGVDQIKKIVKAMKEFSHPGDDTKFVDLNHAIETTVTVARNEWKYVANVRLDLASGLPAVACNPSEINQVLLNLIVNAAQAIADVVGPEDDTKGEIRISTGLESDHVIIAVADTGCGIPESIQHKIYDPFFTTKGVGKGTGQGLAIAHRIVVDRHGGSLAFESTVGKGTRFVIRLPLAGRPEERPASKERRAQLGGAR